MMSGLADTNTFMRYDHNWDNLHQKVVNLLIMIEGVLLGVGHNSFTVSGLFYLPISEATQRRRSDVR